MLHACLGVLFGAVLVLCSLLPPSPQGKGTHQQLGLPGCLVSRVTGLERCPSCGLTTAFCYILHGRLDDAQRCHVAALPVFGLWLLAMSCCVFIAVLGKNWLLQEILVGVSLLTMLLVCWVAAFIAAV